MTKVNHRAFTRNRVVQPLLVTAGPAWNQGFRLTSLSAETHATTRRGRQRRGKGEKTKNQKKPGKNQKRVTHPSSPTSDCSRVNASRLFPKDHWCLTYASITSGRPLPAPYPTCPGARLDGSYPNRESKVRCACLVRPALRLRLANLSHVAVSSVAGNTRDLTASSACHTSTLRWTP